jgi:hypothetical protein
MLVPLKSDDVFFFLPTPARWARRRPSPPAGFGRAARSRVFLEPASLGPRVQSVPRTGEYVRRINFPFAVGLPRNNIGGSV